MAINYSLVLKPVNPKKLELGNKTYAVAQYQHVLDLNAIAKHMSQHDSKYNKGDIMAILTQMAGCLREQLLLGNKVVLGDMGGFFVSLSCEGVDNASSFTTAAIKKVRVRWDASSELSNLKDSASFRYVTTRAMQKDSRKAEKLRLDLMATVQPEGDGTEGDGDLGV